ncbi:Hemin ABC transporter, permease protein [Klebsiella variicola]|nr:Hemin ABC transporter, permease protein [Klebsiella variicola]
MRPALAPRLLLMTLLLVSLTLFATTLGAMRLPLVNLLPSGDEMLRHIWLSIRLPRCCWPCWWARRWPSPVA